MHSINEAKKVTWDTYMEYTFGVNKKERKFTIVYHTKLSKYNTVFTRGYISYSKELKNYFVNICYGDFDGILNIC